MSLFRPAFTTVFTRNIARYNLLQPRNLNAVRQYATKIDPVKKSSSMKLLLIGVSAIALFYIRH